MIAIFKKTPELEVPPLVFFDTKKQQTRLTVADEGCFIELENKENGATNKYKVEGKTISVKESNKSYKDRIGLVDIGNRENWLYSKRLFLNESELREQINLRLMGNSPSK